MGSLRGRYFLLVGGVQMLVLKVLVFFVRKEE